MKFAKFFLFSKNLRNLGSILIGYASLPIGREKQFKKEMAKLFKSYRKSIEENFPSKIPKDKFSHFYIPKFYMLFSTFDLASLSVMNFFEFGSQTFCPFHPDWPKGKEAGRRSFDHKVILGPTPKFSEDMEEKESQSVRLAKATFLSKYPMPLIAICQLKLNNALLIGAGADFVRCAIKAIRRHLDYLIKVKKIWQEDELQLIILESYSWHELTLLLFSTGFNKILQFILDIREMTVSKMKEIIEEEAVKGLNKREDISDWDQFDEAPKLGLELIKKSGKSQYKIDASHIFSNSTTTLGFRFEIFEEGVNTVKVRPIDERDDIYASCRWSAKAGHLGSGIKAIIGIPPEKSAGQTLICAGKGGDFIYAWKQKGTNRHREAGMTLMPTKELIERIVTVPKRPHIADHITAAQTILAGELATILPSGEKLPEVDEGHFPLEPEIKRFVIDISRIRRDLHKFLRRGISKVASKRMLNAIALFNEGIQDRFLFSNFIELKPYVDWLLSTVQNLIERGGSLAILADCINEATDTFEKAWRNRFYAGWRMSEITDFNLEFKGGIQQLLSAFDGAYKAVSSVIGVPGPITLVADSPRIFSTEKTIQLNYFDIFKPELFAARVSHEASEHRLSTFQPEKFPELSHFISLRMNAQYNVNREVKRLKDVLPDYLDWFGETTPITYKLFKDIFADLNAYYFTYFQNSDLFTFWYRNIFITDPLCWKIEKDEIKVKPDTLVEFVLRFFFVLRADALPVMEKYWTQKEWEVFPESLQKFNDFVETLFKESKVINDWYNKAIEYVSKRFSRIYGNVESIKKETMKMKDFLKEGRVYPYDTSSRQGNFSGFRYVQCLSHAYLTLLKEECLEGKHSGCNVLLKRDANGKPDLDHERDARILFDRRGGTFLFDPTVMQNYFKYRCAFAMSLWDMSAKEKYYYVKKFL